MHQTVSAQEKQAQAGQASLFEQMTNQAQQIFGASSKAFNSIFNAYSPIVAAGPNQEGYSVAQMSNLMSNAVTSAGIAGRNAMAAAKGAFTGSLPSGAAIGAQVGTANAVAQNAAQMQSNIRLQSANLGWEKFSRAADVLGQAPNTFNAATNAGQAATGSGQASAQTAEDITKTQNAPGLGMSLIGTIGGVLGGMVGSGGLLSNMTLPKNS
jgi:hypothetical protein